MSDLAVNARYVAEDWRRCSDLSAAQLRKCYEIAPRTLARPGIAGKTASELSDRDLKWARSYNNYTLRWIEAEMEGTAFEWDRDTSGRHGKIPSEWFRAGRPAMAETMHQTRVALEAVRGEVRYRNDRRSAERRAAGRREHLEGEGRLRRGPEAPRLGLHVVSCAESPELLVVSSVPGVYDLPTLKRYLESL